MNKQELSVTPPIPFILSPNLYGLMICLNLWLAAGILSLVKHLWIAVTGVWSHEAEKIIIDVVIILAILELVRTLLRIITVKFSPELHTSSR